MSDITQILSESALKAAQDIGGGGCRIPQSMIGDERAVRGVLSSLSQAGLSAVRDVEAGSVFLRVNGLNSQELRAAVEAQMKAAATNVEKAPEAIRSTSKRTGGGRTPQANASVDANPYMPSKSGKVPIKAVQFELERAVLLGEEAPKLSAIVERLVRSHFVDSGTLTAEQFDALNREVLKLGERRYDDIAQFVADNGKPITDKQIAKLVTKAEIEPMLRMEGVALKRQWLPLAQALESGDVSASQLEDIGRKLQIERPPLLQRRPWGIFVSKGEMLLKQVFGERMFNKTNASRMVKELAPKAEAVESSRPTYSYSSTSGKAAETSSLFDTIKGVFHDGEKLRKGRVAGAVVVGVGGVWGGKKMMAAPEVAGPTTLVQPMGLMHAPSGFELAMQQQMLQQQAGHPRINMADPFVRQSFGV